MCDAHLFNLIQLRFEPIDVRVLVAQGRFERRAFVFALRLAIFVLGRSENLDAAARLLDRRDGGFGGAVDRKLRLGLEFALAKTVPLFHALTVRAYEALIAWPSTLRLDPTDLIALSALWFGWRIWTATPSRHQQRSLPPAGWVILSLAVVATMADAAAPNYGVYCLAEKDGNLYAVAGYDSIYISRDGGTNWQEATTAEDFRPGACQRHTEAWQVTDPQAVTTQYQFTPGVGIEKSIDAGRTWHREVDLTREQARIAFQDKKYNQGSGLLLRLCDE